MEKEHIKNIRSVGGVGSHICICYINVKELCFKLKEQMIPGTLMMMIFIKIITLRSSSSLQLELVEPDFVRFSVNNIQKEGGNKTFDTPRVCGTLRMNTLAVARKGRKQK